MTQLREGRDAEDWAPAKGCVKRFCVNCGMPFSSRDGAIICPPGCCHKKLNPPPWSDGEVDILRTLWAQGVPTARIGDQIGGRNSYAVIGKAKRLGLPQHANAIVAAHKR